MGVGAALRGVKKYIAVGSEAAGSRRLWDGGMFFPSITVPAPHPICRHTQGYKQYRTVSCTYTNTKHIIVCDVQRNTCANHMLYPGDMLIHRRVPSLSVTLLTCCSENCGM